jgi:predicted dehydrogenase
VVAVADTDLLRARSVAEKFGIPQAYSDYRELLKGDVELVSVCTPPRTHASIVLDVIEARKHVLLEKPMATSVQDAEAIVHACEGSDVKLCMMHEYRFIPCVQEAKRRLTDGRLGNVLAVAMTAHPQFPLRWSDAAWLYDRWSMLDDVGVHYLDILGYLTEAAPKRVLAIARDASERMGFFNYVQAVIELDNSCVAYLDLSWVAGSFELTACLFGTAGKLDMDIRNNHLSEFHGFVTPLDEISATLSKSWRTAKGVVTGKYFSGALVYHDVVIRAFLDSIARNEDPPIGPQEGKRVIEFLELIKQAAD